MKSTPSSTARRSTRSAPCGSFGAPQTPRPVSDIVPNPSRRTASSPTVKAGEDAAATSFMGRRDQALDYAECERNSTGMVRRMSFTSPIIVQLVTYR